jgi:GDP-D-mannose dehydratase
LVGDARLAKKVLGWKPKTIGTSVARKMVRADFEALST